MARKTKAQKIESLTKRERAMYDRVCDSSRYYTMDKYRDSPILQKLMQMGLIGVMGRPIVFYACFVPRGAKPHKSESFPNDK